LRVFCRRRRRGRLIFLILFCDLVLFFLAHRFAFFCCINTYLGSTLFLIDTNCFVFSFNAFRGGVLLYSKYSDRCCVFGKLYSDDCGSVWIAMMNGVMCSSSDVGACVWRFGLRVLILFFCVHQRCCVSAAVIGVNNIYLETGNGDHGRKDSSF
jgi:hypothetical protein